MKVVISAGGRFVAFHQAHQLMKRDSLTKFFTFSYTKNDQTYLPARLVNNERFCQLLDFVFTKTRLNYLIPASFLYVVKDNVFDYQVSKQIEKLGGIDLFVGWAHYLLRSIPAIRKSGAKIIVESASCHIAFQQKLLEEEYKKIGLTFSPIMKQNREKMIAEYEQSDFIMTPSEFVRKSFIDQGIRPQKILKLTYGCNVDFFIKKTKPDWHRPKVFTVIFVGTISAQKGVHYLLNAWQQLNLPENKTQLLLVGNIGKDMHLFLKKMTLKKNIVFHGSTSQENLRTLYHGSSLFVLPSVQDGFGMVLGEAMASGLPVICTTHTGASELITNGSEGFVVPACSSKGLAEKIEWCYQHQEEAQMMGMRGCETIKQVTWDRYGQEAYDLYEKIIGKT